MEYKVDATYLFDRSQSVGHGASWATNTQIPMPGLRGPAPEILADPRVARAGAGILADPSTPITAHPAATTA